MRQERSGQALGGLVKSSDFILSANGSKLVRSTFQEDPFVNRKSCRETRRVERGKPPGRLMQKSDFVEWKISLLPQNSHSQISNIMTSKVTYKISNTEKDFGFADKSHNMFCLGIIQQAHL